ncbi:MAG TPA: NUDIX hydrolase [Gemmatimonadales bacterium]|jgi:ADP-ribose pyrophosphatase|nr:NUDIX hydrolase [Gemmatimonadales bacterium]
MSLIRSERQYSGRVINLDRDIVRFPDGSQGVLEMIRHPGAAAVVPFLDDPASADPRILLIHQFRHAADDWLWEIPAGTLSHGEAPETCAYRELAEEAGVEAGKLTRLAAIFTTPGFTDERIHLFLASELKPVALSQEDDEFITVHEKPWSAVGRMLRSGKIRDAKSMCALLYVNCFVRG